MSREAEPVNQSRSPSERITEEVGSWPRVSAGPGRRGEFSFKVGPREIGHLHGDHAAHFFFPPTVWSELIEQSRIVPHPVSPTAAVRAPAGSAPRRTCGR